MENDPRKEKLGEAAYRRLAAMKAAAKTKKTILITLTGLVIVVLVLNHYVF